MAGYSDTRQLIIDTLMGRPAGTEIQPEDHQAFALQITDYVRSVELVAGNATPIGFADASTIPVQPDNGQAVYLSQVGRGTTVVFTNFIDQNGNAISVTSDSDSVTLVNLLWNGQYWTKQETRISLKNTVQENDIADGAVTTPKIADKAVVKGKLSEDLQKVLDNAGTKAIRINYDDVEAAKKAIADYNADPNKTVVLVNYAGIRIPATVSDTYNPVIVAYLPEGINVHKLLFQGDAWSETVIYGDNVRYNKQALTAAQKAQARKNIDVDYLTEDEVANLWDTTK